MCCRRFLHPFLRNDPAAIPISAIHNELTDLCEVPGAKSQAAPFENAALQIPRPFEVGDTEGLEQEFARDVIERRASRVRNDSLQKQSSATVVVPDLSPRCHNGLLEHVPTSIGEESMRIALFFRSEKGTFSFHSRPADIVKRWRNVCALSLGCAGLGIAETN